MENYLIEVCVDNLQSIAAALKGGASRIELCGSLVEGGITPSRSFIKTARVQIQTELYIMIRPRSGDFCYTEDEFEIMKQDILDCKALGADGVVFGMLLTDGTIDLQRSASLVQLARPMGVTFHRAFDLTHNPFVALEDIITLGADRLLTSGQKSNAIEGSELIEQLIQIANNRLIIMPGSGIHDKNIKKIRDKTGAKEFHLSGRRTIESNMIYKREGLLLGGLQQISEYETMVTDEEIIRQSVVELKRK
jgi:copper homeostasis protein